MTDDRLLLNAYVDGELDPAHALEFEQRLAGDRNQRNYIRGADARVDLAVEQWPKMQEFLRQDMYEPVGIERSYADLKELVTQFSAPAPPAGR